MTNIQKVKVTYYPEIGYAYIIELKTGRALVSHGYRSSKAAQRAGDKALYDYHRKETATND